MASPIANRLAVAGAITLCVLVMLVTASLFRRKAGSELRFPTTDASRVKFKDVHTAAGTLLPNYFRTIPLSTFGASAPNVRAGLKIAADTQSGKRLIGTIVEVGPTSVTVRVDSWEIVAPAKK